MANHPDKPAEGAVRESRCTLAFHLLLLVVSALCFAHLVAADGGSDEQAQQGKRSGGAEGGDTEYDLQTYGVIVDCGSSGTRAHIYQWSSRLDYPELLQDIAPMRENGKPVSRKFTPGLSSLADKSTEEAYAYIKRVADYIAEKIPSERHGNTVIYMFATAGMRLLDESTQERIMTDVKEYAKEHYEFADVQTKVIPGSLEGMYQWISVNSKAKRFLGTHTSGRTKTYAVIEMGGASAQVTYQLRPGVSNILEAVLPEAQKSVYLAQLVEPAISRHDKPENTYLLHSTTFLGFGSNSARELYLDLLIKKHYSTDYLRKFTSWSRHLLGACFGGGGAKTSEEAGAEAEGGQGAASQSAKKGMLTVRDPCSPKGYVTDEIKKPRRMLDEAASGQTIGFIAEEDEPTFSVRVQGTGQYNKCRKYVEEMVRVARDERLNCRPDEPPEQCTMLLVGENFIPYSFDILGLGDIYYTMNTMLDSAGTYDHEAVVAKTKEICQTSYSRLKAHFPHVVNNPRLADRISSECFKAVWVDTFLVKVLRMPTSSRLLKTVGQINGDDLEWTLGAVLDKSLAIEEIERSKERSARWKGAMAKQIALQASLDLIDNEAPPGSAGAPRTPKEGAMAESEVAGAGTITGAGEVAREVTGKVAGGVAGEVTGELAGAAEAAVEGSLEGAVEKEVADAGVAAGNEEASNLREAGGLVDRLTGDA